MLFFRGGITLIFTGRNLNSTVSPRLVVFADREYVGVSIQISHLFVRFHAFPGSIAHYEYHFSLRNTVIWLVLRVRAHCVAHIISSFLFQHHVMIVRSFVFLYDYCRSICLCLECDQAFPKSKDSAMDIEAM